MAPNSAAPAWERKPPEIFCRVFIILTSRSATVLVNGMAGSGNWHGKSFIQGRRVELRQVLYMPALVAIRFNLPLKAKYQQLRAAGKPAKVAIVAIMRKLIIIANALLRDNRKWTLKAA